MDFQLKRVVQALRRISRNEKIKVYLLQNPPFYKTVLNEAMRFIGGETLDECFQTAEKIIEKGHAFTVDFMGESTRDEKTAKVVTKEFLRVIEKIKKTSANASISLDLSHLGMMIDKDLALENASKLAQKAKESGIEIMISMEGTDRTDNILGLHKKLCKKFDNVGITLQAYLYRTEKDLDEALDRPVKIRLVKGAYEISREEGLPWGRKTDAAYRKYMKKILKRHHLFSIATHDEQILHSAENIIKRHSINSNNIEIEMLHMVKNGISIYATV
ncbi:proline dehydrogenase family protein [Candidatus Roizmanbacteria bacterium]|nr:proline dehydrogenase family protein [Candidatus Roizmanbacteria bacterium]